jgi:hypothetical protein
MISRRDSPRLRLGLAGIFLALLCCAVTACSVGLTPTQTAADGRVTISRPYRNSEIVIGASKRFAGAIDSLTWNGQEFVNAYDHGRQMQSAANFDGARECLNPTEAGSLDDDRGDTSTSQLIAMEAKDNRLVTHNRMAFWLAPGQTSPSCRGRSAVNTTKLSGFELMKTVTIGAHGIDNVIEHDITFRVPSEHKTGTFAAVAAYMPASFSDFWTFDRKKNYLAPLDGGPGEQPLPAIAATPDGKFALGLYSPDLPQGGQGYGRFRYLDLKGADNATVKLNCVFREKPVKPGDHRFVCYSIVGTLDDVKRSMARLVAATARQAPRR